MPRIRPALATETGMRLINPPSLLALPLLALPLAACGSDPAPTSEVVRQVADVPPEPITDLDILFVIDSSYSMAPHQAALIQAAQGSLFGQLELELGVLPNLQIGVITTDMDAGPTFPGCATSIAGRLHADLGCSGIDGSFLSDVAGPDGTRITNYEGTLADAFACVANVGVEGCGFEQPFAAMQRALDGTIVENEGFLRPDAMLLVVFVGDEDDCSATDTGLFDPEDETLGPLSSYRCFAQGIVCDGDDPNTPGTKTNCHSREDSAYVTPVASFVDFLNGVKGDPTKVMVAGLFGRPDIVEVLPPNQNENGALDIASVCGVSDDGGTVWPAPRMKQLVESFPARYELGDLCDALAGELSGIATAAATVMSAAPCVLEAITDPSTCRAFDVVDPRKPSEQRDELPACSTNGNAPPCFELEAAPDQCGGTPSNLAVFRHGTRPSGTHLVVECAEPAQR
jgi:hypothetical protein